MTTLGYPEHNGALQVIKGENAKATPKCPRCGLDVGGRAAHICDQCRRGVEIIRQARWSAGLGA